MKDKALIFLAVAQTLTWAGIYYIFPALLLRWEGDLGWSKIELTGAITLAIFVSAFVSPLIGKFIDKGYGPYVLAGAALWGGIMLAALSAVTKIWQFYAVWGLLGVAMGGCLYEPCFALITRVRGSQAKQSIIFITLVAGFAGTISFPTAYALSEAFHWRVTVQIFSLIVILIAAPMMWFGARQIEQGVKPINSNKYRATDGYGFLRLPTFWLLAFGFAFMALTHGITLHHLLPILDDRGIHPEVAVLVASFIGPMQVAGRLAMMAAEKHVSIHAIAVSCFIVVGASIVLLFASNFSPTLLVGFVILFGAGYGTVSIIRPLVTRDMLGQASFGAKSGALAMPYLIGSASAPYLGSYFWGIGGYDFVLLLIVSLALIGLTFYLVANRTMRLDR